jgi:hypothetical protein
VRVPVICVRANVRQVAPHLQILQAEHLTPMYCCIPSDLLLGIGGACGRLLAESCLSWHWRRKCSGGCDCSLHIRRRKLHRDFKGG